MIGNVCFSYFYFGYYYTPILLLYGKSSVPERKLERSEPLLGDLRGMQCTYFAWAMFKLKILFLRTKMNLNIHFKCIFLFQ